MLLQAWQRALAEELVSLLVVVHATAAECMHLHRDPRSSQLQLITESGYLLQIVLMEGGINDFRVGVDLTTQDDWADQYMQFIQKARHGSHCATSHLLSTVDSKGCDLCVAQSHVRAMTKRQILPIL